MKKIRSFTSIWSVEKIIYAISDIDLPFPVTMSQMGWFVITLLVMIFLGDKPPLSFISSSLIKYAAIPIAVAYFMNAKSFDGKKPLSYFRSVFTYISRPRLTNGGKAVKLEKQNINVGVTIVTRSEINEQTEQIPD